MYKTTFVQDVIWYTNPIILLACAFCLRRGQEYDRFRGFFCYLIFTVLTSWTSMVVFYRWGYSSNQYFYSFWAMNLTSVVLAFVALYEVVGDVLTAGTLKLSSRSIIAGVTVSLIMSTILALTLDDKERDPLMKLIFMGDNVLRFNQVGILLGLGVMTVFFGLYWGRLAFGIAAGYGLNAVMDILTTYLRRNLGPSGSHISNLMASWSYQAASLVWLFYLWKKPKSPTQSLPSDNVSGYSEPIERLIQ